MGFLTNIFRKKEHKGHTLTDQDRELSLQIRQSQAVQREELRRLTIEMEKLKVEAFRKKIDKASIEDTLIALAIPFISEKLNLKNNTAPSVNNNSELVTPPTENKITDEHLQLTWNATNESIRKQLLKLNDEQLKETIRKYKPSYDEDTLNRAVSIARANKSV